LTANGGVIVDVRRIDEDAAAVPDALRIPPDLIPQRLDDLRDGEPIVLACTCLGEATSVRVAHWLRDQGLEAYAVRGGMAALKDGEGMEFRAEPEEPDAVVPTEATALSALRHERFRRYSAGVLFSLTGNWVEAAAFGYIVLLLGGSAGTLGLIGFLNTIPNLVFGLPAGALADRYD